MNWPIVFAGLAAAALVVLVMFYLQRAGERFSALSFFNPSGKAIAAVGLLVFLGGVAMSFVIAEEKIVGWTAHEVEVVSRKDDVRRFAVTLRNLDTGRLHENQQVGRYARGGIVRCPRGPDNLQPGMRFTARFNIYENEKTRERNEYPDTDALKRAYC